jgi:hypothetical protein
MYVLLCVYIEVSATFVAKGYLNVICVNPFLAKGSNVWPRRPTRTRKGARGPEVSLCMYHDTCVRSLNLTLMYLGTTTNQDRLTKTQPHHYLKTLMTTTNYTLKTRSTHDQIVK